MRMSLLCLAAWLAATLTAAPQAEIATRDVPVTFKTSVRLVSVPVVVRDRQGRAVGNLERDDFQLFAGGKTQIVSRFSVEKLTGAPGPAPSDSEARRNRCPPGDDGHAGPLRRLCFRRSPPGARTSGLGSQRRQVPKDKGKAPCGVEPGGRGLRGGWHGCRAVQRHRESRFRFDLAAGRYIFQMAFHAGEDNFGKVRMPLVIDPWDSRTLALSALAIAVRCLRARSKPRLRRAIAAAVPPPARLTSKCMNLRRPHRTLQRWLFRFASSTGGRVSRSSIQARSASPLICVPGTP